MSVRNNTDISDRGCGWCLECFGFQQRRDIGYVVTIKYFTFSNYYRCGCVSVVPSVRVYVKWSHESYE